MNQPVATVPAWQGALIRRPGAQLLLTSFLVLYLELLLIRWMPAHFRFLSYFTNFILMASLLGLGIGILSSRRWPAGRRGMPWLVLALAGVVAWVRLELRLASPGVLYYGLSDQTAPPEAVLVLPVAFLLVALLFVWVGRPLGLLLVQVTPPLRAYTLDLVGSLAGIAAFFLLAATEQPSPVWFGGLCLLLLVLAGPRWTDRLLALAPGLGALAIAGAISAGSWWSPYYRVRLDFMESVGGWQVSVNNVGHQVMAPSEQREPFYRLPYEVFGRGAFRHALIIGAGSGTDVAIALRHGVGQVDAVEIDPVIARLGARYHPEQPYSDPRVTVHVDDGRSFLRRTEAQFDLIVFALTDSLTLTSQYSSLRLESFLFTTEAFREARARLASDGLLVLYNYYREGWLLRKLAGMLEAAFREPPYVVSYGGLGRAGVLMVGPRLAQAQAGQPELAQPYRELRSPMPTLDEDPNAILLPVVGAGVLASGEVAGAETVEPPAEATDDWPFVYLRGRGLPALYLAGLAMVVAGVLALALTMVPREARGGINGHMFFLGAAFMLLETHSLVQFALLFGSTWLVNSLVFFAILCSVLLAVLVSGRWQLRPSARLYSLLLGSLLFAYLLPGGALLAVGPPTLRYLLASVVAFLPIFLANLVFANSFKLTGRAADVAFASNLLGTMVGGMLEYAALLLGYRHLLLLVLAFYALSGLLLSPRRAARFARAFGVRPTPAKP